MGADIFCIGMFLALALILALLLKTMRTKQSYIPAPAPRARGRRYVDTFDGDATIKMKNYRK